MQANTQSIPTVTVQSGRPSSKIEISAEAQQEVRAAYLSAHRQRFKAEINRLTGGTMSQMLQQKSVLPDEAAQLGFMMSYLYAWYWLQQNVNTRYQSDVLSSFAKGAQAFLMEMLLDSKTASDFTQAYIKYWQQYQGESQLQQQNCLQLLQEKGGVQALSEYINTVWSSLKLFSQSFAVGYKDLAKQEKDRYADMLGPEDRRRLALVDQLADT
jgi:hypothetical protein